MKLFTKIVVPLCILAIVAGSITIALTTVTPKPARGDVLYEDEPAANPLRVSLQVDGVSGSRFFIQSPRAEALDTVYVSSFGAYPENEDNAEALNNAFAYVAEHPGTRLIFDGGVYYVSDRMQVNNATDVLIDGNGSTILTDHGSDLLDFNGCDCVEFRNLTIDWDWDKKPLSAIARAVDVPGEKHTIDFIFDLPQYAVPEMFYAITQCDSEGDTYGDKGTLIEFYNESRDDSILKEVTKISEDTVRVVHDGTLDRFGGNKFILRSTAYGGAVLHIEDRSRNVTFYDIKLYGGSGMGIVIGNRSSHFALRNVYIGPNPEFADTRFTSVDADAVHINDSDGCFLIEGCDFSRQGDDDVNINSGIGWIESVEGKTVEFVADGSMQSDIGDTMIFRDTRFAMLDGKAIVESCERLEGGRRKITFAGDLPAGIVKGGFIFNADCTGNNYVIRNNYFHEHRARGLLLQTSNGLVEGNRFYKTSHDAIRIVMDINGVWHEGTGCDNILIRNNVFEQCGYIGTEVIEVGTHLLDKSNRSFAFTNICIENNEFKDICGNLLAVNNVNAFAFNGNTITLGKVFRNDVGKGRAYFLKDCANVEFSANTYTDASPLSFARMARSDDPFVWLRINFAMRKRG